MQGPRRRKWLTRALTRPPFHDEQGRKGWLERFARPQRHVVTRTTLRLAGWPLGRLRIAFLSDFHVGAHSGDVERLGGIIAEAQAFGPDLALFGGDYVNMQVLGGGRVPPRIVAMLLGRLEAPCGRFAVLGNHDLTYGEEDVATPLRQHGITVLRDERASFRFRNDAIDIIGIEDARSRRLGPKTLLAQLARRPTIVLTHDPVWFADVPPGPHLTLAGHTHGGQVKLPVVGIIRNASHAPFRWTHGHVVEESRHLFVTAGLGTSGLPLRIGVPPEFAIIDVSGGE